ncbi:MAG: DUF3108 domain-containing protein [Ferrovibrio sp.]|uniref:DUF3108 domain-containing protein n=1 Tax=Ferrovibrio sp. TaxID=1917215 RepID=UPI00263048A6|nr:DUF3108 domain-containing protein [Ferrovibrio sp.]MCW0236062.1 DUF3108 domain-containing protein [Ferrovibrio sp.]
MSKLVAFLAIPLLLSVPAALAQPGAGAPLQQAELGFGLYALGSKGLEVQLTMRRDADDLRVEVAMRTAGMLDWAMRMTMTGLSAARIGQDGQLLPVRYTTDSDGTWSKRLTRMSWDANGLPIAEVFPPNDEDDREEVPDLLKRNTLDPTTAMVSRVLRGGPQPPCQGSDAIYDGRRRYNMHFSPLGPDTVKPHNRTAYDGPAFKCMVKLEPVAGYSRKFLAEWSEKDEQPTYIWLVRPPGFDAWLPVKMEGSSRIATASTWISSARLNDTDWLRPVGFIRAEVPSDSIH